MVATTTVIALQHYEFKLSENEVKIIGQALQKQPMELVYPIVMNLERQIQEQNFALQQLDVQNKVTTANAEALNLAAATGEIPTVTMEPVEHAMEAPKQRRRTKPNGAAAHV